MKVIPLLDGIRKDQLVSPRNPRFWTGFEQFAKDSGSDKVIAEVNEYRRIAKSPQLVNDSIIPSRRLVAYDPTITIAETSRIGEGDLAYQAFGANRSADPRAKTFIRTELSQAGEVSEWCCGIDSATMDANLREYEYNRGWFGIRRDFCWTDQMEAEYAGVFDVIGMYRNLAVELLNKVATEVAFFGHEIYNLRGLKDLDVERVRLDTPLDLLDADDAYEIWCDLKEDNFIRRGDLGAEKTHMLAPRGFRRLRSQRMTNSVSDATLGKLMDEENKLFTKYTDYMSFVGTDSKPALFLYARNSNMIQRDVPFEAFMLPPVYERGKLSLHWVARCGELYTTNASAGLIVENALTGAQ